MNRDEPLTPEERELARLLGRRVEQAPPAALDATILAAARAAVHAPAADAAVPAEAPRRQRTRPRWPAVFGIAAAIAVGAFSGSSAERSGSTNRSSCGATHHRAAHGGGER